MEAIKQQVPRIGEFKGYPVIVLNPEEKFPFSFGVSKARLILQNIDAIKTFVESQTDPTPKESSE